MFLRKYVQFRSWVSTLNDDGQSTAEYSLVIIGAATVAGLLIAWAAGSGAIGALFDLVLKSVAGRID